MDLKVKYIDNKTIIKLPYSQINANNIPELSGLIFDLVPETNGMIYLDLGNVETFDSKALSFLISLHKRCITQGGKLSLLDTQPNVMYLLTLTSLTKIFEVYKDEFQLMGLQKETA